MTIKSTDTHIDYISKYVKNTFIIKEGVFFDKIFENLEYIYVRTNSKKFIYLRSQKNFDNFSDHILKKIIHSLIRSIISGEHIYIEQYDNKIIALESILEKYLNYSYSSEHFFLQKNYYAQLSKKIIDSINILSKVLERIKNLNNKLKLFSNSTQYDIVSISNNFSKIKANDDITTYFHNLILTLKISELEYVINDSTDYYNHIKDLTNIIDAFENKEKYIYLNVLKIKLSFLETKWLIRTTKNIQNKNQNTNLIPIVFTDNKIIKLSSEEDQKINITNPTLIEWIDEIKVHYLKDDNLLKSKFIEIENKEIEDLSQKEFRLKIKFYKKIEKSPEEIIKIINYLISNKKDNRNLINILYGYNNLLSLLIKENKDFNYIKQIYKEVIKFQNKYNLINFFAELKFLEFQIDNYNTSLENNKEIEKNYINSIEIEKLYQQLEILKKKFINTCIYNNLLYNIEYKDSCLQHNEQETSNEYKLSTIYYHGSILLPISTTDNDYKIKKIESKLEKLKALILVHGTLNESLLEIKNIKSEVNDNNKRLIESFAIFTGIISFIVGSISSFQFIETFIQALIFMLLFGLSISLFVLLIFISTRGLKKVTSHSYIFICYVIILFILGHFLFPMFNNDIENNKLSQKNEGIIKFKLDSIRQINENNIKAYDSLQKNLINKVNKIESK